MLKRLLLLLLVLFSTLSSSEVVAQNARVQAREQEWKAYVIPDAPFSRMVFQEANLVMRVPAGWKQSPDKKDLEGPHLSHVKLMVEKLPIGTPLSEYITSVMRYLKDLPEASEAALVRRTEIQDLEARELVLELQSPEGEMIRSTMWLAVRGPYAFALRFAMPLSHAAELEPYFKAMVQSITFGEGLSFEDLRTTALKDPKPTSVKETQTLVDTIVANGTASEIVLTRLSSLYKNNPDSAIDLLCDRRPFVRSAAVQAVALSRNPVLEPFLWRALDDREPLIGMHAAIAVAPASDVISKLAERSFGGFRTESLGRLWPFLSNSVRIQILQKIFSAPAKKPVVAGTATKVTVSVGEMTAVVPGSPPPPAAVQPGVFTMVNDPSVQLGALTLLDGLSTEEFKLPLSIIVAADHDPLTVAALQVALRRVETVPVDVLLKLSTSSNAEIRSLAADNLGLSGQLSDVEKIQKIIERVSSAHASKKDQQPSVADLKLAIEKIQFRDQLSSSIKTSPAAQEETIKKGLSNKRLSNFVWDLVCVRLPARCGASSTTTSSSAKPFQVMPFGENLLPDQPMHFVAIPRPAEAVQKLYQTLNNIQLDSARAQSNLVLIMSSLREVTRQQLGAPSEIAELIDFTGIKGSAPLAAAAWTAAGAAPNLNGAQRQAMVLSITNREQFERFVTFYTASVGNFGDLPTYIAGVSRALPALPAILPFSAKMMLTESPAKPKFLNLMNFSTVGTTVINGVQVKTISLTVMKESGRLEIKTTYLAYFGDKAVVTADVQSMRELLARAAAPETPQASLANNPEFQKSIKSAGDVVYFSNLKNLLLTLEDVPDGAEFTLYESGELNFLKSSWQNSHRLTFDQSEWSKYLTPFNATELVAPGQLLPSTTIAYLLVHLDVNGSWQKWLKYFVPDADLESLRNAWTSNFESEVLPELGPECGLALLYLNDFNTPRDGTWLGFCKLKSNKIKEAWTAGRLFRGVGPTNRAATLKIGTASAYFAVHNDFLIVSNDQQAMKVLDSKEFLAPTRDYSRSVAKVPRSVVAFGGYNLEAANAAIRSTAGDGLQARQADVLFLFADVFHSQNLYATAQDTGVEVQSSVSMDREGRFSVADLANVNSIPSTSYVTVEPHGVPIADQKRLSSLTMRVRTKAAGAITEITKDVATDAQKVEQKSDAELLLKIAARKNTSSQTLTLPVTDPSLASFLVATPEIQSTNADVVKQAREIAANDKDAWSVAKKLADWTFKNLEWRYVSRADAAQTLATREADCSEFSQLYVAMARALGLPARIVTGLAYSGSSFGGHAWVEVWNGRWIELDPTWGTHFVDATHIRNTSGALQRYAALSAVDLEIVSTDRTVADFQLTPKALAEQVMKAVPKRDQATIEAALDLEILTDELMGKGEWSRLTDGEREQMSAGYRRIQLELYLTYGDKQESESEDEEEKQPDLQMRLLQVDETGDRAIATGYVSSDQLIKLHMVRRGGGWHLVEFLQKDLDFPIIREVFHPVIETIKARRAGQKGISPTSPITRSLLLLEKNPIKAIEILDKAIQSSSSSPQLLFLKAVALLAADKNEEGRQLLVTLAKDPNPYSPALYRLAELYWYSEKEEEKKQVIELLTRYLKLEPADIRAHTLIASAYDFADRLDESERSYRKVVELDPAGVDGYSDLAEFLVLHKDIQEVSPVLNEAEKYTSDKDDFFGSLMTSLYYQDESEAVEKLAAAQPIRMKKSASANIALGGTHMDQGRNLKAIPPLQFAATLDRKSTEPHVMLSRAYGNLSRWALALAAADKAVSRDFKDGSAHYQRACVLARLRRTKDAMNALSQAVQLAPYFAHRMAKDDHLKSLSSLPEFKKLLPPPEEKEP